MYRLDKKKKKTWTQDTVLEQDKNPSFSSTLLDQIYRSIDEGAADRNNADMSFYTETTALTGKKQSRTLNPQTDKKSRHAHARRDRRVDAALFSSTSGSSESSSGGLSSSCSDTESMYGRASCFAPSRPKPVRTSVPLPASSKPDSNKTTRYGVHMLDAAAAYSHNNNSNAGNSISSNEEGLIKSKSRALKIYNNLKKVKQPISPKLTNFLNSLFTTGNNNAKKTKAGGGQACSSSSSTTACSSASSFARSCLSKNTPSTREKRTVRFYPVSVIVDEESRACGHKYVYEEAEEEEERVLAVSVPTAWKIGRAVPNKKKSEELQEFKFLKEYNKSGDIEEDDDVASYSSSDLFELDHLAVMGENTRYCEELPVYETTHFGTTYRAIANGFMV